MHWFHSNFVELYHCKTQVKFHIGNHQPNFGWVMPPNFKEVGRAYCFWVGCPSVCPSFRSSVCHAFWCINLRTLNATVLKFLIWIPHEKIADTCFFSWQDYAPFQSYGPLKKYGCNLVSKISQKLLKLESWNLVNRLVVMRRQPDYFWRNFEKYFLSYGLL